MGLEPPKPEASAPAAAAPGVSAPPEPAVADSLPDFAKKADDLEAIKQAVDDAASVGGGLWLSYLFVLFYLAIAAGAVTHEDLFFEHAVKLPFLTVELPLLAFFFLAPILFIIVHAYTLVHLVFLTEKAKRYHQALHSAEHKITDTARANLQWQLPSNIFIQFLAGPSSVRRGAFGWLLRAIAWVTLVIGPILLLLLLQVQFLPFHSSFITWTQRLALVVDLALIWWLWGKILSGRETNGRCRGSWAWAGLGVALSLAAILFSGAAATFPGEWQEDHLPAWRFLPALAEWGNPATENEQYGRPKKAFPDWVISAKRLSLHDWLFSEPPDGVSRRRFPFSNTLVLTGLNIYEGLGIDDPEKAKWHDYVFRARGRDLRGAIFDFATMPKVDFEGTDLESASFNVARLTGASLEGAQLQNAQLQVAQLQGASLALAQLQGASFYHAELQGALLEHAQLRNAALDGARLQGASLADAKAEGVWFRHVQLQGASLAGAELRATLLRGVQLQGASLSSADLEGADLEDADLEGASVDADLPGASLRNARLPGATFQGADLRGASLQGARLQGASLALAWLQGASFDKAILEATDLRNAFLWRSHGSGAHVANVGLSEDRDRWRAVWTDLDGPDLPWDKATYRRLREQIEALPLGPFRNVALEKIQTLDCNDQTPCSSTLPPGDGWRSLLVAARVDETRLSLKRWQRS